MPYPFAGPGVIPALKQLTTNRVTLQSGETVLLSPAGWYAVRLGRYTVAQQFDPITGMWFGIGGSSDPGGYTWIFSDGANYRLANQTGAAVGALLTNGGSGYSSAPTVTASAGSSLWKAFVGGAVSTTVTISNGGSNYTYPPQVLFSAPPNVQNGGGIPATGYATLSGGAVSSVTVTNQGAGYTSPPTITFVNDPRETNVPVAITGSTVTQGSGAAAACVLTGAQTVTGVLCYDHGQGGQTAVPTLSFSGGGGSSAAATAIMCWSVTAYTTSGGTGYPNVFEISGVDVFPTTSPAYTNPDTQLNLVRTRRASIKALASSGVPTATGQVVTDGGIYTAQPTATAQTGALITAGATLALTMGGQVDTSYVMTP